MPRYSFKNVVQFTKKQLGKKKVEANRQLQNNNNALKKGMKTLEDEAKKAKSKIEEIAYEVKSASRQKQNLNTSLNSINKKYLKLKLQKTSDHRHNHDQIISICKIHIFLLFPKNF